ncbi:uncharacterized protein LOC131026133 [Salvia miltiorrhiza]|uniref:uncharacterized protein LOC131026133 n=1 Tax=Salvia miltiorrhiza TaxID=226208 RepID=UPI0025ACB8C3|nr:uncharacterized protein LOC131026133 [Salvia miltiorrhiza]
MCQNGRASWDSDPERVARFLQEFGNDKLGLNIPIDVDEIKGRLLVMDDEIKRQSKSLSSSDGGGRPAAAAGRRLFIRRQLQKTDVDEKQGRLSMPCSQVDEGVLTAEEAAGLRAGMKMAAKMVDGEGREYDVNVRWTRIGVKSSNYAIRKPWNEIKKDNGFREGMLVEVWGVRSERGDLSLSIS